MEDREFAVQVAEILEGNCRLSAAEIAAMLEADEERVSAAIEAMEQERIIVRYGAKVDWQKLDEERKVFANIAVSVTPERDYGFDKVAARIARYPEVHSLYLLSGGHDLEVVIEGDSMRHIALFVAERLAPLPGVNSTSTHFVLRVYKRDGDVLIGEERDQRLAISP